MTRFIEDLRKVPVLRILFPLIIGILGEQIISADHLLVWLTIAGLLFSMFALLIRSINNKASESYGYLLYAGLFLLLVGAGMLHSREIRNERPEFIPEGMVYVFGTLTSDPAEKSNSYVVSLETEYLVSTDTTIYEKRKLLLYLPKDSLMPGMLIGENWLFQGRIQEIKNNGNPGEFDYAAYMQRKGIWSVIFVDGGSCKKLSDTQGFNLRYFPAKIRRKIQSTWDLHDPDHAVLSAITLGDKTMIPIETKNAFVESGAMHLLAVSGLHVGMIWWILDLLIVFPRRKAVFRVLKVIIILGILWIYAGITGFSESVTRSVTMFSLISVARSISRTSNIYNTLFLSAFILLLIKPTRITEPGFQLSYLAVFGIVTIHPLLEKALPVSNKLLKRVTDLVFVSIAAQLATFPVSLIYFHQFPVYFILTNICAIPLVSILLALFVVSSPFFILNFHSDFFLMILKKITHVLNYIIELISSLPVSAIRDIPMSIPVCILLILLIFSIAGSVLYRRVIWMILSASIAIIILIYSGTLRMPGQSYPEVQVYNFRSYTAISTMNKGCCKDYLLYNEEVPDRFVVDYLQSRGRMNRQYVEYSLHEVNVNQEEPLIQLCQGAWGITSGEKKILICGKCRGSDLDEILRHIAWDIVVFRNAYPRISESQSELLAGMTCIADGSLRDRELTRITMEIPDVFLTSKAGAWSSPK